MKPASGTMISNLSNYSSFWTANLLTITLFDGTIVRYTDFESDVILSGTRYSAAGPWPIISGFQQKVGVEVDQATIQLWSLLTNTVESAAVLQAIGDGLFDGADVLIQRVMMPNPNDGSVPRPINFDTSAGAVTIMHGNVGDVTEVDSLHAEFSVNSRKELLNIPFPFAVFQPSCRWPLYGPGCTLNKASFAISGAAGSGGNNLLFNTNLTAVDGDFDQGVIAFTSGPNNGINRTVRLYLHASGEVLLYLPLPLPPAGGDTFTIYPGCDKTMSRCDTRFSNLANYGGFPFVPAAEAAI